MTYSRRCGNCGGIIGSSGPGEKNCTCEQVRCVTAQGSVIYVTQAELDFILSARPPEVVQIDVFVPGRQLPPNGL